MSNISIVRPALIQDTDGINQLLSFRDRVHRHLDWLTPIQRLGEPSYWLLEQNNSIQAALSCPEDPENVGWVRFFAAQPGCSLHESFQMLLDSILQEYSRKPEWIVSVAVHTWYLRLLMEMNFHLHQTIVVLQLDTIYSFGYEPNPEIYIRPIYDKDLEEVTRVDHEAFDPIWRYSYRDICSAYKNSSYATVAEYKDNIIGYQISSSFPFSAHLARLAVVPSLQGKGIGRLLTTDMIRHYSRLGAEFITVNTQSDNTASLHVYKKLGFSLTGEKFPVMRYQG